MTDAGRAPRRILVSRQPSLETRAEVTEAHRDERPRDKLCPTETSVHFQQVTENALVLTPGKLSQHSRECWLQEMRRLGRKREMTIAYPVTPFTIHVSSPRS